MIVAVGRKQELHQIIGADRHEIRAGGNLVNRKQQGRHFDHHSELDRARRGMAEPRQMGLFTPDNRLGALEFIDRGNHREHDFKVAVFGRPQQSADLRAQQARPIQPDPDGAPAQSRIFFIHFGHIGQDFIAADIERAEGHGQIARAFEHRTIERGLLAQRRQAVGDHELQFGAEQADALRAGFRQIGQIEHQTGIELQRHLDPVFGNGFDIAQAAILRLPRRPQAGFFLIGMFDVGRRADMDQPRRAIDNNAVSRFNKTGGIVDHADSRNSQSAGDNGDMALRPAFLQHQPAQARAVVIEQRGRPHRTGHQNGIVGQIPRGAGHRAAAQQIEQAVGQFIEIVQTLAQIGVVLPRHAGTVVRLHAFNRGFRRQACHHGFGQPSRPATVGGEHAEGFQHVAVFAAMGQIAALQNRIERGAQGGQGLFKPFLFLDGIIGDQVFDDNARLVQHHMAEADTVSQRLAFKRQRPPDRNIGARRGKGLQFARGNDFRQHHGSGLQSLDFLLDILARGFVLHDQNAKRHTLPQNGHAEEGLIDFFARFRLVGEGRMGLSMGEIERFGPLGDQTDQTLARPHRGFMHGLGGQTLCGIEFERAIGAHDIERAHFGNHVAGDQCHDFVKAFLRVDGFRHHFAEPPEQYAWTAECASHHQLSLNWSHPLRAGRSDRTNRLIFKTDPI